MIAILQGKSMNEKKKAPVFGGNVIKNRINKRQGAHTRRSLLFLLAVKRKY